MTEDTMNCKQFKVKLQDFVDNALEPLQVQSCSQHLNSCSQCQLLVEQEQKIKTNLQAAVIPEPSIDFEQRVMNSLHSAKQRDSAKQNKPLFDQSWFAALFGGAVTAALMIWVFSFNIQTQSVNAIDVVSVELVPNKIRKVNLAFNSPQAIEQATFKIILPANVEISGHKGKRELQWVSRLNQGANRLALPLIANGLKVTKSDEQFITARISHQGKSRDFKIKIISKAQQSGAHMEFVPAFEMS